jgi:hypothetical protein
LSHYHELELVLEKIVPRLVVLFYSFQRLSDDDLGICESGAGYMTDKVNVGLFCE